MSAPEEQAAASRGSDEKKQRGRIQSGAQQMHMRITLAGEAEDSGTDEPLLVR